MEGGSVPAVPVLGTMNNIDEDQQLQHGYWAEGIQWHYSPEVINQRGIIYLSTQFQSETDEG